VMAANTGATTEALRSIATSLWGKASSILLLTGRYKVGGEPAVGSVNRRQRPRCASQSACATTCWSWRSVGPSEAEPSGARNRRASWTSGARLASAIMIYVVRASGASPGVSQCKVRRTHPRQTRQAPGELRPLKKGGRPDAPLRERQSDAAGHDRSQATSARRASNLGSRTTIPGQLKRGA
jgi:hypothetical protein